MKYTRLLILLLLFISGTIIVSAQKEQNIWVFGTNVGIDFNSGHPIAIQTEFRQHEGCASICNADGQLLFYTDGSKIWNRNYKMMPNGDLGIGNGNVNSITQAAVIMEVPGSPDRYYVFTNSRSIPGLYYCIVDMNLDNGLGDVVTYPSVLNEIRFDFRGNKEERMAVVQGDDCDFWLMIKLSSTLNNLTPHYRAYKISAEGISSAPVQSVSGLREEHMGAISFSPDRKKMASASYQGVVLYDFDPATGALSNPVIDTATRGCYGVCFSPDNSKLYISANGQPGTLYYNDCIFQYDLKQQANVIATRVMVGMENLRGSAGYLKAGPDNKIYQAASGGRALNVISNPNLPGMACGLIHEAIPFVPGTFSSLGLPNEADILHSRDTIIRYTEIDVCFKDSILLTSADTSGRGYTWSNGEQDKRIWVATSGVYVVRYKNLCTYYVDSFRVIFGSGPLPILSYTQNESCSYNKQDTAIIAPHPHDSTLYSYRWYNDQGLLLRSSLNKISSDTLLQTGPGNYRLNISTSKGCDTTLYFTINASPYEASFITDSFYCQNRRYTFQNTSTGNLAYWYWDFGNGDNSFAKNPEYAYEQPGTYGIRLIASSNIPCYDTFLRYITVDTLSYIHFTTDKSEICAGESIVFQNTASTGIRYLQWRFGNEVYPVSEMSVTDHTFEKEGIYPITLTGKYRACPDTFFTDTISVYPLPLVYLGHDTTLCPGFTAILFQNLAPNQNDYRYVWNTGDITEAIKVKTPGIYKLTITSGKGCSNTDIIEVKRGCYIDIPNVFTPNGDGVNDYFFPRQLHTKGIHTFRMRIWDRWGSLIFEGNTMQGRGWDGRYRGVTQPSGVYVYHIELVTDQDVVETYRGNVTLIR